MNFKLIHIALIFLMTASSVQAQDVLRKDTSYTIRSAFNKYIKKYPQIEIVKPQTFVNISEKKNIIYKEIGSRKLQLDAFLNTEEKQKPAVILVHGGGWKSGDKSLMAPLAQYIASKGYACFAIEYRLSLEAKFPAGIYDIKNAIQFVKTKAKEFNIDSSKVAILGCSSGGQMASLIGTTNHDKNFEDSANNYKQSTTVHAIIDVDGILAFKHPESKEGEVASQWLGGNYQEIPDIWQTASALTHTDLNTPPTLFIGSQFNRFLAGKEDMIKILDNNKIYNQTEIFPDSPHSFWLFHPWFEQTVKYITTFLDKTLIENIKSKEI